MTEAMIIDIVMLTMRTVALLCAPPTIAIVVVGIVSNIIQTVTQMKDPALAFVPKVVAVGVVFIFTLPWYLQTIQRFTQTIFGMLEIGTI